MGRIKRLTKAQADREIKASQSGFLGGMNLDSPISEIDSSETALAVNHKQFRTHSEIRSGTKPYTGTGALPGSGTIHTYFYHSQQKAWLLHRGTGIHISFDNQANYSTMATTFVTAADADSRMSEFGNNVFFSQATQLFVLEIDTSATSIVGRKANDSNPSAQLNVSSTEGDGDYLYRYTYTFLRQINEVELVESGSFKPSDESRPDFTEVSYTRAIEGIDQTAFTGFVTPVGTAWTHIKIYRTLNLGVGRDENNPETYYLVVKLTLADAVSYTTLGIGSMIIGSTFVVGKLKNGSFGANDNTLSSNGVLLSSRLFTPIPDGLINEVTPGFIFVATDEDDTVNYSDVSGIHSGYFHAGFQFLKLYDRAKVFIQSPDSLIICCASSTYRASIFSSRNPNLGSLALSEFVAVLDQPTLLDNRIGVLDVGSVSKVSLSQFIAHCSDRTIRIWDGSFWGVDLASFKIETEIKKIRDNSVGVFDPEGFYILFYSDTSSDTETTKTLRLGLKEDVGKGWGFYSGTEWIQTPLKTGALSVVDPVYNIRRLAAIDASAGKTYWIESFDGPDGTITRATLDKEGDTNTDIPTSIRFKEITGSSEYFRLIHEETHLYLRPFVRGGTFLSGIEFNVLIYGDDNAVAIATYNNIDINGQIWFTKRVEGFHRLSIEVTTNKGNFSFVGYDTFVRVQDVPIINRIEQTQAKSQDELAQDLTFWSGRPEPTLDRTTGNTGTTVGNAPTLVTGADGNSNTGLSFSP